MKRDVPLLRNTLTSAISAEIARRADRRIMRIGAHLSGLLVTCSLFGCAGSPQLPQLSQATASLATVASGTDIASSGTPSAVYSVIAGKAMTCWFGPHGPLKSSHIFHADLSPPSEKGEIADIVLHERDLTQPTPRGARAYRILLTPNGDTATHVEISNARLPDDLADALRTDVLDWTRGGTACKAQVVRPPQVATAIATGSLPAKSKTSAAGLQRTRTLSTGAR
ncbi:MAG: hypothetical protein ABL898_03325 [Hyphomicrobiaceae bacterium]